MTELMNNPFILPVQYLENHFGDQLRRGSANAAGIDLPAGLTPSNQWVIVNGCSRLIHTGIAVAIPEGYYGRIVMRSGHGIGRNLSCHVGTIDADYRGEIKVLVRNHQPNADNDQDDFQIIASGERFAQLIIQPYLACDTVKVDNLDETERGERGFGSTGS